MQIADLTMPKEPIETLHTLGPRGTNCEAAAHHWFALQGRRGRVVLHDSLEVAADHLRDDPKQALLSCIVYPDLHKLVFSNLDHLQIVDLFILPTHNMVLASRDGEEPAIVATHPAPQDLVGDTAQRRIVLSNSRAAMDCAQGVTDGCITTSVAARAEGLTVVRDFGPVPMGFALHRPVEPAVLMAADERMMSVSGALQNA